MDSRKLTEKKKEEGFWKWVNSRVNEILKELKEDSVAANPTKPVDCCNPPVPDRTTKTGLETGI